MQNIIKRENNKYKLFAGDKLLCEFKLGDNVSIISELTPTFFNTHIGTVKEVANDYIVLHIIAPGIGSYNFEEDVASIKEMQLL